MGCNNYFDMTDQGDSFESWQGLRGPAGPAGPAGKDVQLRGPVATVYDLPVTAPASELWQVGTQAPYIGYFFNGATWISLGPIAAGTTFTPSVSSAGVISWTNDGGLPNPESVNIKGPQGETGATGPQGPQGETGATGPAGPGVPAGGSAGQVLKKQSSVDYDTAWETEDLNITGASVGDLVRISAVSNGKPTAFDRISDPNENIGIVQNTNTATQDITAGQYVIWHGALYTARTAIASGATLSGSNLTEVTNGGLNAIQSALKFAVGGGESSSNALQFLTFETSTNQSASVYLPSGFRGLLFSSSAWSAETGIINVIAASNGNPDAGKILGSTDVTINTSTQNAITVQTPHYAKHTLLAMASGTSIQN